MLTRCLPTLLGLLLVGPLAAAPVGAPRPVGLIADASAVPNVIPFIRCVDIFVENLASSRQWDPTVLTETSPLLRAAGATWPATITPPDIAAVRALAAALRLDDILLLVPVPGVVNTLEVIWVQPDTTDVRRLQLVSAGTGDTAYSTMAKQLVAALQTGFASTAGPSEATAGTAPVETAPAAPTKVTTVPDTSSTPLVANSDHQTPATEAPKIVAPAGTPGQISLSKPAAPEAGSPMIASPQPALSKPAPPETSTTPEKPSLPADQPLAPAERPAPATPATVPAPATAEASATESQQPSPFIVAAQKFLQEGDFNKAQQALENGLQAGASKPEVYYLYAQLERARGNPVAERSWLQQTIAKTPENLAAHLRLAELLRGAGLWRKAVDEYDYVIKADPANVYAYLGLSATYAGQNQPKRAADILSEAVKKRSDDASLYLRLGDLHAQRRALAEAEEAYDRAAHLMQGDARADVLDRLGDLYVSAQRSHEGFICFAEASRLRSTGTSPMTEKRYQQIMGAADETLVTALDQADRAMQEYLAGRNVFREEAFSALNDLNGALQEVMQFTTTLVPPVSLKLEHAKRGLAYELAAEATLNGLTYLDRAEASCLETYQTRIQEARKSLDELPKPVPASKVKLGG